MGLRLSALIFPGVRYTASTRRRRKGQLSGGAVLLALLAIYIPIALAVTYWRVSLPVVASPSPF